MHKIERFWGIAAVVSFDWGLEALGIKKVTLHNLKPETLKSKLSKRLTPRAVLGPSIHSKP